MDTPDMPADNPSQAPQRRRRLFVRLGLGCATVFLVAVTVLTLIVVQNRIDGPPVDDADLTPPVPDIPPEENAGPMLLEFLSRDELFSALDALQYETFDVECDRLMGLESSGGEFTESEWQASEFRVWIAETEVLWTPALEELASILERPKAWLPPAESLLEHDGKLIGRLRVFTEFILLTSRGMELEGDGAGAVRRNRLLVQCADRCLQAPRTLLEHLVARAALSTGVTELRRLSSAGVLRASDRTVIQDLESLSYTARSDTYAILREYQLAKQLVLGFLESEYVEYEWAIGRLLFRPNDTVRLLAEKYRKDIVQGEATGRATNEIEEMNAFKRLPKWRQLLEDNSVGLNLLSLLIMNTDDNYHRGRTARLHIECTRALLGLSVYHREHGRLPDTLTELVPEILSTVPTDPWDGQPLRYDPERRLVWSVGTDGVDGGAVDRPEDEWDDGLDTDDPYVEIPEW